MTPFYFFWDFLGLARIGGRPLEGRVPLNGRGPIRHDQIWYDDGSDSGFLILTIFGLIEDILVMDMIFQGIRGTKTMILCAKLNLIRKEIVGYGLANAVVETVGLEQLSGLC
jgi:hypothetical protein